MKSFEQIARAMFDAYANSMAFSVTYTWDVVDQHVKDAWVKAAKAAHKEITELH